MTNPFDPKNQMSRDLYTSGSNFKFLPGGESIPEQVSYPDRNPLIFSGTSPDTTVFEDEPVIQIVDNPDTDNLNDTTETDSEIGDFSLPESFTLSFSPESSKGIFGSLSIDSSGATVASVDAICSAVSGVDSFEIRLVKK